MSRWNLIYRLWGINYKTFPPRPSTLMSIFFSNRWLRTLRISLCPLYPTLIFPPNYRNFSPLKTYSHLTLKPSDNRGNIMVLNNQHYKQICLDFLDNPSWYKSVLRYNWGLNQGFLYSGGLGLWNPDYLKTTMGVHQSSKRESFDIVLSPKDAQKHKHLSGQPIISWVGTLTQNASMLVDTVLRPHVQTDLTLLYKGYNQLFKGYRTTANSWGCPTNHGRIRDSLQQFPPWQGNRYSQIISWTNGFRLLRIKSVFSCAARVHIET